MQDENYWENKWQEHLNSEDNCLSFAVLCNKCEVTASYCECRKTLWINEQKDKAGIKVIKPYTCYICKQGTFSGCKSYDANANDHVTICPNCIDDHEKDSRHIESFTKKYRQ